MKKLTCLFILLLLLPITSCATITEQSQLEDFGLVEVMGYDLGRDGKSRITVTYTQTASEAEAKSQLYTTEVNVNREALIDISKKSNKSIHFGQLRVLLFSEEFARQRGLEQVVKELYQDPVVSNNVLIAVVKGNTEDFLMEKDPEKPPICEFLTDLLRPRNETFFNPYTTIHDFIYTLTNEISDPMTPYLAKENEEIEIKEIAVFKGDRMIDSIAPWESNLLYGLAKRKRIAAIKIEPEEMKEGANSVLLEFVQSNVKTRSNKNFKEPRIKIKLSLKGQLYGYTGDMDLDNPDEKDALQDEIAKKIELSVNKLLEKLQDLQVDPIQMGEALRMHYRGDWSKELWNEILPKVEYDVEVDFDITTTGTLE